VNHRSVGSGQWYGATLLALPFLVVLVLTEGLTQAINTFHGGDELRFHYPQILDFAAEAPDFDFSNYASATTPLFHLAMMAAGKLAGFEIWKLRLLNAAISLAAVFVLWRLLARGQDTAQALLLALAFGLSPYFFGTSFILLTDNLALLLFLSTLYALERFAERPTMTKWSLACCALALCLLTRQAYLWLAAVALYYLLSTGGTSRQKWSCLALLGLALAGAG
jgi:4-amino-4-deoxy-L-arabinose transferase-like glycosyltransferase